MLVVAFAREHYDPWQLVCGVSQGSVLGFLLFVLCAADVMEIARSHSVETRSITPVKTYINC